MSDTLIVSVIPCSGKNCTNTFTTAHPVNKDFTYACKLHPKKKQTSIPIFQEYAHDKLLDGKEKLLDFSGQDSRGDREMMHGTPILPRDKCEHGVYDPHRDQRYCSVCNPVAVAALARVKNPKKKKTALKNDAHIPVAVFKSPNEQIDQAIGVLAFHQSLKKVPAWLGVHFTTVDDLTGLIDQWGRE